VSVIGGVSTSTLPTQRAAARSNRGVLLPAHEDQDLERVVQLDRLELGRGREDDRELACL
jgi:hypothetical protein